MLPRSVSDQWLRETDARIRRECVQDLWIRLFFRKNRHDLIFFQSRYQTRQLLRVRHLLAVQSLHRICTEPEIRAEIVKGRMCRGQLPLIPWNFANFPPRPPLQLIKLCPIHLRILTEKCRVLW